MRSSSANSLKPATIFPPIHSPSTKPPRTLPRKTTSKSSDKLPQLVPTKNVITRCETLPETVDVRAAHRVARSNSTIECSTTSAIASQRLAPTADPFSTPARRRRLVADIARFLLKQYCIKACGNVARWRLLTKCATRIQSIIRMYLAIKEKLSLRLQRRHMLSLRIQQAYRLYAARKELRRRVCERELQMRTALALRLQCFHRRQSAKVQLERLRQEQCLRNAAMLRAATHMQKLLRGQRSRKYAQELKRRRLLRIALEHQSCIVIQCAYRIRVAKRVYAKLVLCHRRRCYAASVIASSWKKHQMRRSVCALSLQRVFRGVMARALYAKLRWRAEEERIRLHELRQMRMEDIAAALYRKYLKDEEERLVRYLQGSEPLPMEVRVEVQAELLSIMRHHMRAYEIVLWCCTSGLLQFYDSGGCALGPLLQRVLDCISQAPSSNEACIDVSPAAAIASSAPPPSALPQLFDEICMSDFSHRPITVSFSGDSIHVTLGAEPLDMAPFYARSLPFVHRSSYHICLVETSSECKNSATLLHSVERVSAEEVPNNGKKRQLYRYNSDASEGGSNVADMLRLQFRDAVIEITQSQSFAANEANNTPCTDNEIVESRRESKALSLRDEMMEKCAMNEMEDDMLLMHNEDNSGIFDRTAENVPDEAELLRCATSMSRPATARVRVRMLDAEEQKRKALQLRQKHCSRRIQCAFRRHLSVRRRAAAAICLALKRIKLLSAWRRAVLAILLRGHLAARCIQSAARRASALQKVRKLRLEYCRNMDRMVAAREEAYDMFDFSAVDRAANDSSSAYHVCCPTAKVMANNPCLRSNELSALWIDELLQLPIVANCVRPQDIIIAPSEEWIHSTDSIGDILLTSTQQSRVKKYKAVAAPAPLSIVAALHR